MRWHISRGVALIASKADSRACGQVRILLKAAWRHINPHMFSDDMSHAVHKSLVPGTQPANILHLTDGHACSREVVNTYLQQRVYAAG